MSDEFEAIAAKLVTERTWDQSGVSGGIWTVAIAAALRAAVAARTEAVAVLIEKTMPTSEGAEIAELIRALNEAKP